jgi:curli biogenesis system outer membrane secretion channel CsgG
VRRFISSVPGKVFCHALAVLLLMPTLTLAAASSAMAQPSIAVEAAASSSRVGADVLSVSSLVKVLMGAQFKALPNWAVVPFVVPAGSDLKVGDDAAEAMTTELGKLSKYDVVVQSSVKRMAKDTLGLPMPVTGQTNLMRLGRELGADSLVTGEILNYRIIKGSNTKRADVIIKVRVMDVASGVTVNGSATVAHSADKVGDPDDALVLGEALTAAASQAVAEIDSRSLPIGTVLNTSNDTALLNQGTQTGFHDGQQVIILRGRLQVASGVLKETEPDQSTISIKFAKLGVQPGDRVRAIYDVPDIQPQFPSNPGDTTGTLKPSTHRGSNDGLFKGLLLGALVVLLFGGGRSGSSDGTASFSARAGYFVNNLPVENPASGTQGVLLQWVPDPFLRSVAPGQPKSWYFFRSNNPGSLVQTAPGDARSLFEPVGGAINFNNLPVSQWDLFTVNSVGPSAPCTTTGTGTLGLGGQLIADGAISYSTRLVYEISTVNGNNGKICDYWTGLTSTSLATPLTAPKAASPANGTGTYSTTGTTPFTITIANPLLPPSVSLDYCIEVSPDANFSRGNTIIANAGGPIPFSSKSLNLDLRPGNGALPLFIRTATQLAWRVGIRNDADRPGPFPDKNGQQYIWSMPAIITPGP